MSKEMKRLLFNTARYDLYGGIIFSLILFSSINWTFATIYFLGLMVALINFIVSGKVLEYLLSSNKGILLPVSYTLRILIIILLAVPFFNNLYQLIAYLVGYLSHFLFLIFSWVKHEKGSD